MTTEEVLEIITARGFRIEYGPGGPRLRGDNKEATPKLLRVLKIHREEIDRRLRPKPPPAIRRVVLLAGDGPGVEKVLLEFGREQNHHGHTRRLAGEHPGRAVACEWRHDLNDGAVRWERFLTIKFPEAPCPEPQPNTTGGPASTPSS